MTVSFLFKLFFLQLTLDLNFALRCQQHGGRIARSAGEPPMPSSAIWCDIGLPLLKFGLKVSCLNSQSVTK